ncbi:MAG: T9SS type A sorting domain-containing protein [Candidatus Kapabacteria bacterium]|nr:T9SS type A sorting domain-containing protein [Ignavibacteriota bacterium]MCW5884783.1 T9SS type A sorting domain-containing protein [Candidatus Kapabacteria bacterium]
MNFNNKSLESYFKSARNHKSPITDEKMRHLIENSDNFPSSNFINKRKGILTMTLSSLIIAGLIYFGLNTTSFENISNVQSNIEITYDHNISNKLNVEHQSAAHSEIPIEYEQTTNDATKTLQKEYNQNDKIQGLNSITLNEDYLEVFGVSIDTKNQNGEIITGIGFSTKMSPTAAIYSVYTLSHGSTHRFDKITENDTTKHIRLAPEALTNFKGGIYLYSSNIFIESNELDEFFPFRSEFNDFMNINFHSSISEFIIPENIKLNLSKLQSIFKEFSFKNDGQDEINNEIKLLLTKMNEYFQKIKVDLSFKDTSSTSKHDMTFTFFKDESNKDSLSNEDIKYYDDLGSNVQFVQHPVRMIDFLKIDYPVLSAKVELINEQFQNYVFSNKMVAIEIPTNKDKTEGFIFWYKPSQELIELLPAKYSKQLAKEFKLLEKEEAICGADINVEETYLDIWRTCSGSIENLRVFPNPVETELTVKFDLKESRNIQISIYDLEGNKIMDLKKAGYNSGINTEFLDLTKLVPGIYIIAVQSNNNEITMQRIIKK